jgi:phosphotransferase system IIB component
MTHILNFYLLSSSWFTRNYWWLLLIVIAILAVLIVFFSKPKKVDDNEIDEEFVEKVITGFGGLDNLVSVSKDGSRLKFTVADVEKCQLENIKALGAAGVFVSGKQIKFLFPFPSDALLERINSKKTEAQS